MADGKGSFPEKIVVDLTSHRSVDQNEPADSVAPRKLDSVAAPEADLAAQKASLHAEGTEAADSSKPDSSSGGWLSFRRQSKAEKQAIRDLPIDFERGKPPRCHKRPLSYLTFEWFTTLLWNGSKHTVQYDHLFQIPDALLTDTVYGDFEKEFIKQHEKALTTEKGRASVAKARAEAGSGRVLLRTILARHWGLVFCSLLLTCLYTGFQFTGPLLLNQIVGFMQQRSFGGETDISVATAYVLACLMFVFPVVGSTIFAHANRLSLSVQLNIRAELAAAIYRKALRLSSRAKQQTETGKVVNLMSADITQIMTFVFPFFSQLITAPVTIIGATIFLITQISWATFIGLFVLVLTTPASGYFVKRLTMLRREMLKYTDKRVKLMNQLLVGIRVVKLYAWEAAQEAAVQEARRQELNELRKCIPMRVGMQTLLFAAPTVAAVCTFVAYGAVNPDGFTPKAIFTSIALFNLMRFPLIMVPFALVQLGNAIVSMRRITQFLLNDERHDTTLPLDASGIRIEDGEFYWEGQVADAADKKDAEDAKAKADALTAKASAKTAKADAKTAKADAKAEYGRRGSSKAKGSGGKDGGKGTAAVDIAAVEEPALAAGLKANELNGKDKATVAGVVAVPAPGGSSGESSSSSDASPPPLKVAEADELISSGEETEVVVADVLAQETEALEQGKGDAMTKAKGDTKAKGGAAPGSKEEEEEAGRFYLKGINLEVKQGQLVCVVGRVGSGKSSLISAVLGEMERMSGAAYLGGRVAYVAQQAWITNDTLRNNVLFGSDFDEERWDECLQACCLESDLDVLPAGAETEIGEKGINLSGGQKQRVSLARASYQDADVYVMDDPLSAVDVHVGRHIFEDCFQGLLGSKTRLLVTNQLQYLQYADNVVVMENGRIAVQGSIEQCMQHEAFVRMMAEFNSTAGVDPNSGEGSSEDGEAVPATIRAGDPLFRDLDTSAGVDAGQRRAGAKFVRQDTVVIRSGVAGEAYGVGCRSILRNQSSARGFEMREEAPDAPEPTPEYVRRRSSESRRRSSESRRRASIEEHAGDAGADGTHPPTGLVDKAALVQSSPFDSLSPISDDEDNDSAKGNPDKQHEQQKLPAGIANGGKQSSAMTTQSSAMTKSSAVTEVDTRTKSLKWQNSRAPPKAAVEAAKKIFDEEKEAAKLAVFKQKEAAREARTIKGKLVKKEDQESGQVGWEVYWYYAKAFYLIAFVALLVVWSCEQTLRVLTNWWLSKWTQAEGENMVKRAAGEPTDSVLAKYMSVYVGLAVTFIAATFVRSLTNLMGGLRASKYVHHESLHHLIRAPVSFFDTTPVGRILNRFSKDTDDMDFMLPQSISEFGNCIFQLIATVVFICVIQYWFIAGIIPLMLLYYTFQHYYRRSYIELQRQDAVTRSPIYAHFSETLSGVETIRAYGAADRFALSNDVKVDYNHRAYFNMKIADEWLSMRLELVGASITFMSALLAVINTSGRNASILALTLTESLEVTAFLKYAVRAAAMFESRFNAIERLSAYTKLPQEAPNLIKDNSPPPEWPTHGAITYKDVWMRYRPELEPVLRGVSFQINARDKVGIVGRTGSGKSSLIVTLFRLAEPFQGSIVLDGVDILALGLEDVRGRIAAIPQDPVLFSGTVRSNLDPFDKHSDVELWDALGHVALKDTVSGLPGTLAARVAEGGENFSVGQRQLLCVARALLRKPRVLVADEATASVDGETDSLIQRTIRANFKDCTVLTIAHRLNTILDSTKVLVMAAGKVEEFDTVKRLLSRQDSQFRRMVSDAGLLDKQAASGSSSPPADD